MPKLYACIISADAKDELLSIAHQFSARIETLEDGVLFDVGGLERLIGKPDQIAQNILEHLKTNNISGNVAVASTVDTAILLARQKKGVNHTIATPDEFQKLPLRDLGIANDSIGIFNELGIHNIEELRQIPADDLINRYGQDFQKVLDVIGQNDRGFLTPNIKESKVAWKYELDFAVDDFEQLIFIINHGLDNLLGQIDHYGLSTEQLDISFQLRRGWRGSEDTKCTSPRVSKGVTSNSEESPLLTRGLVQCEGPASTTKTYEIKTSFPTLEKTFWLKLINLRVSLDPPEAAIMSVTVTAHFTKPRPDQRGLYAVSRPEPESLLLTVNKIKKLVGEDNVGLPVLLNQRLAKPFTLDADKLPEVRTGSGSDWVPNSANISQDHGVIAFIYYHPPVRAEVLVRDGRLVYIKTRDLSGHVTEYSGVWKANSKWWDKSWKTQEWDVEVENNGIYRLCKVDKEWFLAGEYD